MELKPGYKQTEVGVIPEDWEIFSIGSLVTEMRGGAPLKPKDFVGSGVKVLPKGGIGRTGWLYIPDNEIQFCLQTYASTHRRNQVDETFIIVVLRDLVPSGPSIGLMVRVREPETYVLAQGVYGIKVCDRAVPSYFVHLSNTNWYRRLANTIMVGSTQVHITNTAFKLALIPLPPVTEQEAIAEALSDADALIESLNQLIAKKHLIKQGAMQELLTGKRRLPGFNDPWIVCNLGELADIRSGGTPSTTNAQFWDGDVLWCTPTDITALKGSKYLHTTSRTISNEGLKASSAEIIPANSIVMTSRATIGECAINSVPLATNQGFKNFVPYEHIDIEFFYYLLITQRQGLIGLCSGSTFLEIGKTQLSNYQVYLPITKSEQHEIAITLSDMDYELSVLEARLEKAHQIKQGMMQALLTGRVRLIAPKSNVIQFPSTQPKPPAQKSHSDAMNDAVIISVLAHRYGTEQYPLGRFRYTKLSYLLHRYAEHEAAGYFKKAAGPYKPATKYQGGEKIAVKNGYVREHQSSGGFKGFVASENIAQAEKYFNDWYGADVLTWLDQFKYKKKDELELLTTVDMAMEDVRKTGGTVSVITVKQVFQSAPEWVPKLDRAVFSDDNIGKAIAELQRVFQP